MMQINNDDNDDNDDDEAFSPLESTASADSSLLTTFTARRKTYLFNQS